MTGERATNCFGRMGTSMTHVDNVSGRGDVPFVTARYRPRPERKLPRPLKHRAQLVVDGQTGAELDARLQARLNDEVRYGAPGLAHLFGAQR